MHDTQGDRHLAFWDRHTDCASFVYVLQGDRPGPIKVGYASDVRARIATLQTGNPQELHLLHVVPGDPALEWALHKRLRRHRILLEWFEPVQSFLDFVEDLAERMVGAYDGTGAIPAYRDFGEFEQRPTKTPPPMAVRYVEPAPKVDEAEAQRIRRIYRDHATEVIFPDVPRLIHSMRPTRTP